MILHQISAFASDVASISSSRFGVAPTVPFSSLADPDASSVTDLLKSIPGVTYTPQRGVILPDPASELGELCGDLLNGLCSDTNCTLIHPPFCLLAGAVCSVMTKYCQPTPEPQPSPDLASIAPSTPSTPVLSSQPDVETHWGGSLIASYCRTCDPQEGNPNPALVSISAMAVYCDKSHEELRLEDYQLGNKGSSQLDVETLWEGSLKTSFCRTCDPREGNPNSALVSISAMGVYCDKSHEELRLEDYQLGNKGKRAILSGEEKIRKLYRLFLQNRHVHFPGIYKEESITTDEAFVRHCNTELAQQLCDRPGPLGYLFYEAADIYKIKSRLKPFHELAEYIVDKYNSEEKENLEVKKVVKSNIINMYMYMTMEVWDKKTNRDRTFRSAIWVKGWGNFVVGFFKEVTSECCVSS